jgi:hypothetical protein
MDWASLFDLLKPRTAQQVPPFSLGTELLDFEFRSGTHAKTII